VAGHAIPITSDLISLGTNLDSSLSLTKHVKQTVKTSYYHLRALRHIRPLLSEQDSKTIAAALVHSKLDYANAILYATSQTNLKALQRVQNSLARIVHSQPLPKSTSTILSSLHWLPISARITYKIACLTYTALYEGQPSYLAELLHSHTPSRTLRSSNQRLLTIPRTSLHLTDKSFHVAAPTIWNSLPLHLRFSPSSSSFRSALKTHLFDLSYS